MNKITINGKSITCSGSSIVVTDDKLYVNGKLIEQGLTGEVIVKFEGDLASLECHNANVTGSITGDVDCHNLKCHDIIGRVKAHNLQCNSIKEANFK